MQLPPSDVLALSVVDVGYDQLGAVVLKGRWWSIREGVVLCDASRAFHNDR